MGQGEKKTGYSPIFGQAGSQLKSSSTTGNAYRYGNYRNYSEETNYNSKPIYGIVGTIPYQYTKYPYFIHFYIMGKNDLEKGKPLYHATLISTSDRVSSDVAFKTMLKGYMEIFPGHNGQTQTIAPYVEKY
jgi:hypothetical protein